MRKVNSFIAIAMIAAIIFAMFTVKDMVGIQANSDPEVTLTIGGSKTQGGPILYSKGDIGQLLWAPGKRDQGVMRIYNHYSSRVRISSLALHITLEKLDGEQYQPVYDRQLLFKYAKYMKLKINMGKQLLLDEHIFDGSFYQLFFEENNDAHRGYTLNISDRFGIETNDYRDLEYTVEMDKTAGNDMQGLRASVKFIVNAVEYPKVIFEEDENTPGAGGVIIAPADSVPSAGGDSLQCSTKYPEIKGHWAYDSICNLIRLGVVIGYKNGSIKPDSHITRLEAAVLIGRALKLEPSNEPVPYKDKIPAWGRGYAVALYHKGIMIGVAPNKFGANTTITREELATILCRIYKLDPETNNHVKIKDVKSWSAKYIRTVVANDIMTCYKNNTFKPKQKMTRAETMDLTYKAIKRLNIWK